MTSIDSLWWPLNCARNLYRAAIVRIPIHRHAYIHVHRPKNCHSSTYPMDIRTCLFDMIRNNVQDSSGYCNHRIYPIHVMACRIGRHVWGDILALLLNSHAYVSMLLYRQLSMNLQIATLHRPYNWCLVATSNHHDTHYLNVDYWYEWKWKAIEKRETK